jgi:hypothetical protein
MKLSTNNIDKEIRTMERIINHQRVDTSIRCFHCGKKIKNKNYFSIINGLGGLNNYHFKCFLPKITQY